MEIILLIILLILFSPFIIFLVLFLIERGKNKKQKLIINNLEWQLYELQRRIDANSGNENAVQAEQHVHEVQQVQPQPVQTIQQPILPAQSVVARQPQTQEQSKQNARNILLWVGVAFITIAGCVFATTQWQAMGDVAKVIIIMGTVLLFFGLSAVSNKFLKISQTGKAFYILGCIFLPISLIASAFFELFGEWFTYKGEGNWLFWAVCSILLGIALGVGVRIYKKNWIFMLMLICITITGGCIIVGNVYQTDMIQLCFSIYFTLIAFFNINTKIPPQYKRSVDIFTRVHFYGLGVPLILIATEATLFNLLAVIIVLTSLLLLYKVSGKKGYRNCFLLYYLLLFVITRDITMERFGSIIIGLSIIITFFGFHFVTEKKLLMLRTRLSDGLFLGALMLTVIEYYLQRNYLVGAIFIVGEIVCIILAMMMALWIILKRQEKGYAKGVAFLLPIQVGILVNVIFYEYVNTYTNLWLISLFIVGIAIAIQFLRNKWVRLRYLDTPFLVATILILITGFIPAIGAFENDFAWTLSVAKYALIAVYFGIKGVFDIKANQELSAKVMFYVMLGMGTISVFGLWPAICEWINVSASSKINNSFLVVSIFLVILFVAGIIIKSKSAKNSKICTLFASITMIIATSGMAFFSNQPIGTSSIYILATLICLVIAVGMALYVKITLLAIPTVLLFIFTLNYQLILEINIVVLTIEAMATMLLGRVIFPKLFLDKKEKKLHTIDIFAVATLFLICWQIFLGTRANMTVALVTLAVFFLNFYKRGLGHTRQRIMLTLSGSSLLLAWWGQPWINIPEFIEMELIVMPAIAFMLVLQCLIWKKHKTVLDNVTFGCAILAVISLIVDALSTKGLFDIMFLGIVSLVVLLYSFYFKRKKWFCFATTVLLVLAIYMTRHFWASIAWWAYLLIVGILLIVIAAWNERLKQKGTSIKKTTTRLWEEWTW